MSRPNTRLMDNMQCPKCCSAETLVLKEDRPDLVYKGYAGACLECDEDFYLHELVNGISTEQFIEEMFEIAFGNNAIHRDFDYSEVIEMLKKMSDVYAKEKIKRKQDGNS